MYYDDDPFHPNLPNDYDDDMEGDDFASESGSFHFQNVRRDDAESMSTSSMSTSRRKRKKLFEDEKNIDKGYCKTSVYVGYKKVPVEYYHTNDNPGSVIRNAVTGIFETGYKVGKWQEDLFFKVGKLNGPGRHVLFYDSPEQYERHFFLTVDPAIKEQWESKALYARQRRVQESQVEIEYVVVK